MVTAEENNCNFNCLYFKDLQSAKFFYSNQSHLLLTTRSLTLSFLAAANGSITNSNPLPPAQSKRKLVLYLCYQLCLPIHYRVGNKINFTFYAIFDIHYHVNFNFANCSQCFLIFVFIGLQILVIQKLG